MTAEGASSLVAEGMSPATADAINRDVTRRACSLGVSIASPNASAAAASAAAMPPAYNLRLSPSRRPLQPRMIAAAASATATGQGCSKMKRTPSCQLVPGHALAPGLLRLAIRAIDEFIEMMQLGKYPPDPLVIRRLGEEVVAELRVINEGAADQLE